MHYHAPWGQKLLSRFGCINTETLINLDITQHNVNCLQSKSNNGFVIYFICEIYVQIIISKSLSKTTG